MLAVQPNQRLKLTARVDCGTNLFSARRSLSAIRYAAPPGPKTIRWNLMKSRMLLAALTSLLLPACSEDNTTPSFNAMVYYAGGGSNHLAGSSPSWRFDPSLRTGMSGIRIVAMPDTIKDLPISVPQLTDFEVWILGSAVTRFPTVLSGQVPLVGGVDTLLALAAGRVFPYGTDSGTVQVIPLGGNAIRADFDVWFGWDADRPAFRLIGSLVAAAQ